MFIIIVQWARNLILVIKAPILMTLSSQPKQMQACSMMGDAKSWYFHG